MGCGVCVGGWGCVLCLLCVMCVCMYVYMYVYIHACIFSGSYPQCGTVSIIRLCMCESVCVRAHARVCLCECAT